MGSCDNMRYILLFLFLLLTPSSASAVWFDSNWDYRVKVEVVPTLVGSSTAITNFPVYVNLGDLPASFLTNVQASGADIRVTKSDGSTEVAFEVVSSGITLTTSATDSITTSTTTYQLRSDAVNGTAKVEVWAGGGGGGDGSGTGGGGGGGGAFASSSLALATSTNYSITVGTGGAKGALTAAGSNGATTTFNGGQVLASPGIGGLGCASANCAGGAGGLASLSVGSSTYNGGTGGTSNNTGDLGGGGGEAAGSLGTGANGAGQGAGTSLGTGGDGGVGGANAGSGADGNVPGGGGGGGENNSVGSTGNGAAGRVDITYNIATTTAYSDGELHFLADSLGTTSTSTFYIYYGNPSATAYAATDTYGRNAVWTAFEAVYHLFDLTLDSTGNSNTLVNSGGVTNATGTVGFSADSGLSNTTKTLNNVIESIAFPSAHTVSYWSNFHSLPVGTNNVSTIHMFTYVNPNFRRYGMQYQGTGGYGYELVTAGNVWSNDTIATSTWNFTSNVFNTTDLKMYLNGATEIQTQAHTFPTQFGASDSTKRITLFGADSGAQMSGMLDEVRIRQATTSLSWITTEYNNQSSPSTFLWIGAEECDGGCGGGGSAASTDSGIIWFD